jgi:hypothetical protein
MSRRTRRGVLTALLGAALALAGTATAMAAQTRAAEPTFTVTATPMRYGQPDLAGVRRAANTVTVTNTSAETVPYPMLTFPANGRDQVEHTQWPECPTLLNRPDRMICIAEPLAAGEQRTFTLTWYTSARGPAGPAQVRVQSAAGPDGEPAPSTVARARWRVTFERLTGTFDITATDLVYGPADADGVQRGSIVVTITNLTRRPVEHPVVTFPRGVGSADHANWSDCPTVIGRPDRYVCVAEPLAARQSRSLTFPFLITSPMFDFHSTVRVDAGTGTEDEVIEGTAAGTTYLVVGGLG